MPDSLDVVAVGVISVPLIKQRFAKDYLQDKWSAEQQAMIVKAIEGSIDKYNLEIQSRSADIRREKAAGRRVRFQVDVDTEWIDTDFGPAQISANVSYYTLLLEGDTPIQWPLFRKGYGFWSALFYAARITTRRDSYYFEL